MFILMISILIALIIVVFAVQNAAVVPVQFLSWSTELPLVLVIFCSVFAGALLMFCLALGRQLKSQIGKRPKFEFRAQKAAPKAQSGTEQDPIDVSNAKNDNKEPKK